jgi:hypothetical protein
MQAQQNQNFFRPLQMHISIQIEVMSQLSLLEMSLRIGGEGIGKMHPMNAAKA